jgi:hypothetical protein
MLFIKCMSVGWENGFSFRHGMALFVRVRLAVLLLISAVALHNLDSFNGPACRIGLTYEAYVEYMAYGSYVKWHTYRM